MKRLLFFTLLFFFSANLTNAYEFGTAGPEAARHRTGNSYTPAFETRQQAYDRRSNENYNTYRNNNYQAPLGGYNRPLNDDGGRQYGYRERNRRTGAYNW